MMSPCNDPIVLPNIPVQVYILPFKAESRLTPQGRQFSTILQRHVLYAALKYRYIGVEQLTGEELGCAFEEASKRILPKLPPGQSAVFLWARIFEQGDAVYLQSSVAFTRVQKADILRWNLGAAGQASSATPVDPIQFAVRKIPLEFLTQLQNAEQEARRLHTAPSADSPFKSLPDDPNARFTFQVVETRDDWMHIRVQPFGMDGWVPAHSLATAGQLKGVFPELYFVDALIGYEQLFGKPGERPLAGDRRVLEATKASFDQYLQLTADRAESETRALAAILKGNAVLRASGEGNWPRDSLIEAQRYYGEARQLSPGFTAANSFYLACSAALCVNGDCGAGADRLHAAYLDAISRDPTSRELVDNLALFYQAARTGRVKLALSEQALIEQQDIVKEVQASRQ
jgi:hypothetical protein